MSRAHAVSHAARVLTRQGGQATWGQLRLEVSAKTIRRAVASGAIARTVRGRYVVAGAVAVREDHRRVAHRLTGTLSHLSAAVDHGWAVKIPPTQPWVTFRRKRHLADADRRGVRAHWADLTPAETAAGVTSPIRTVLDCARRLPFDEALAIADSALRDGDVSLDELRRAAAAARGPGAARTRRVARHASALAANPLESTLRAIVIELDLLTFVPQLAVWDSGLWARVDLGNEPLKLALEAEGFEAHRTRRDLTRDARRYTELTVWGWSVLRFSWEEVMLHPEFVRWAVTGWLAQRGGGPVPAPPRTA